MLFSSRAFCSLRWRIALILFITAFCHQQHLFFVSRHSLAAKYTSTQFEATQNELHPRFSRPDDEDAEFQDEIIANRGEWTVLGEGWEGKVFVYKDSVIKTFTPGRSSFRNYAPGATSERWPTEIAASLRFGGSDLERGPIEAGNTTFDGFLPVRAYFKTSPFSNEVPEWHLVTPLLKGGNLHNLAKKPSRDAESKSTRELDTYYRPSFERLLTNIQRLHDANYCHDDIKPANIFVSDDTNWLLGDLGNLRHLSHPYHSSRLWSDNEQLKDCRANDVMRLLKSYMQFHKAGSLDQQQFDVDFFQGTEPLSRLFWTASADAQYMIANKLRQLSQVEYSERAPVLATNEQQFHATRIYSDMLSKPSKLCKAVDYALETRMGEKLARWWAMVGIFGVPDDNEACGF
jgi:serine/threonine protein kinase